MKPAGHASVAAANATYQAIFQEFFGRGVPGIASLISYETKIVGDALKMPLTTSFPQMEEWLGDKVFDTLRQLMFSVEIRPHQASVALPRLTVETDLTGTVDTTLRQFLSRQQQAMDRLVTRKLLSNPIGYDNVSLLNDAHPFSGGTGDNLTTDALSLASVRAMHEQMVGFQDEDAEPLDVTPNILLVGPKNEHKALEIAGADRPIYFNASGAEATSSVVGGVVIENVSRGRYGVVVAPRITGQQWFLIDGTKPGLRPIVTGVHRAIEPVEQTEMTDEGRFIRDEYRWSLEGDLGFGAGLWQLIGGRIAA